jgi:hypothetical protein
MGQVVAAASVNMHRHVPLAGRGSVEGDANKAINPKFLSTLTVSQADDLIPLDEMG